MAWVLAKRWKTLVPLQDGERYKQKLTFKPVLPYEQGVSVRDQFGWMPTSIFKPDKANDLRKLVGDFGDYGNEALLRRADKYFKNSLRGTIFQPHLAQVVLSYWSIEGAKVVDPFAGRGTRGIITQYMKRNYEGYEVSPSVYSRFAPRIKKLGGILHHDDGTRMRKTKSNSADLIFTSPPYHDREPYESCKNQLGDISSYNEFMKKIELCAKNCYRVMKKGAFLCWMVGDWRDKGRMVLYHCDCCAAFSKAGLIPYDIVILENGNPFRNLGLDRELSKRVTKRIHAYLLVFRK